jgi:hypothetical protein
VSSSSQLHNDDVDAIDSCPLLIEVTSHATRWRGRAAVYLNNECVLIQAWLRTPRRVRSAPAARVNGGRAPGNGPSVVDRRFYSAGCNIPSGQIDSQTLVKRWISAVIGTDRDAAPEQVQAQVPVLPLPMVLLLHTKRAALGHTAAQTGSNHVDAVYSPLSELPEELMVHITEHVLGMDLPSALRLCQTSPAFHRMLAPIREQVEARRLRWESEQTAAKSISHDGLSLRRVGGGRHLAWAAGQCLPSEGPRWAWSVRIERSHCNDGSGMTIGVCDDVHGCAWGVNPFSGLLWRFSRDDEGEVVSEVPPPGGYPDGDQTQVIRDADGRPADLRHRANGAVIEVIVEQGAAGGTLAFRINGGSKLYAVSGLPSVPLRPWARMVLEEDQLGFSRPYLG